MRGRPFQRGNKYSRGRPPGSRNKAALLEQELQQYGVSIMKKLVMMALQGNQTALRLCVERLVPRRERTVRLKMPPFKTLGELSRVLLEAVAAGKLTAGEGLDLSEMVEHQRRLLETPRQSEDVQLVIHQYVGIDVDKV